MAVGSDGMKEVVRECCETIAYDPDDNTFAVTLLPDPYDRWQRMARTITLDAFNNILGQIQRFNDGYLSCPIDALADREMVNGEVLAVVIAGEEHPFVKMEKGQYLDSSTGQGIVLGECYRHERGKIIVDAEGQEWGQCEKIALRTPTLLQRLVSGHLMPGYYLHGIDPSLWALYDEAREIVKSPQRIAGDALLTAATQRGISLFTLFYILTAATRWRQ